MVSHELRTPLTSVLGFAKIIRRRLAKTIVPQLTPDDPAVVKAVGQVQSDLEIIIAEGQRLTELINDVLDVSKLEAGKVVYRDEPVSVADVIHHATKATASLFRQKRLELVVSVPEDLPPVHGDEDRLIQVVINLLSNAVKFTPSGQVVCKAIREDGMVRVSVVDTGIGISPDDQQLIFEKFRQIGDTLTDRPRGTGLGLAISKQIIEHHGGVMTVKSEVGCGSELSFTLPLGG
jgi:signal transduction histidine kinase